MDILVSAGIALLLVGAFLKTKDKLGHWIYEIPFQRTFRKAFRESARKVVDKHREERESRGSMTKDQERRLKALDRWYLRHPKENPLLYFEEERKILDESSVPESM